MNLTLWAMCYVWLLAGLLLLASCLGKVGRTVIAVVILASGIHLAYRSQLGAAPVPTSYIPTTPT